MTQEQRNKTKQRLTVLELRLDGINALTKNADAVLVATLQPIIDEMVAEIVSLEKTLATKWMFLFNFKSGGWNSEVAFTREDAIEQAIFKYGHPDTQTMLQVDASTFRLSTPADYKTQLASFY